MVIIPIKTSDRTEMADITGLANKALKENKWSDGALYIYVPHTTAGVTINEHADPSVREDIIEALNKLVPIRSSYRHTEGNSDAHIKASFIGSSVTVLVEGGRLVLGQWQGIFFCEFDGPRQRKIHLKFIGA